MCHDSEEWDKIWRGIDLSFQNWHEECDKFWPEHLQVSKISTLLGSFCAKYLSRELKKYIGFIFNVNEEFYKIWKKADFWLWKWREEFGKFLLEH